MAEKFDWAPMVPEFLVTDISASRAFWCDVIGFEVLYDRPEEGFAYLNLNGAQVMLERIEGGWRVGEMVPPFGRGINFSIWVDELEPILKRIADAGIALYRQPKECWRRQDDHLEGSMEFLVQDPDGYLLRLTKELGSRPLS